MSSESDFINPALWTKEELDRDRRDSINRFVASFLEAKTESYLMHYNEAYPVVEQLFSHTSDLTRLVDAVPRMNQSELSALRFVAAPHLSQDNFKTLKKGLVEGLDYSESDACTEIYASLIDPIRFCWLSEKRQPSSYERETALCWTAGLWAVQKAQTETRRLSSRRQEKSVKDLLDSCGYSLASEKGPIRLLSDLACGSYRSETKVAGQKCDVPVRLNDGRLMLIECKVSNSATNSTKRLMRETCGKADDWTRQFGSHVVCAAVLDGVFSLTNLEEAQNDRGLFLFWESRLGDLASFIDSLEA